MQRILQEKYLVKQLQRFQQLPLVPLQLLDPQDAADLIEEIILVLRLHAELEISFRSKLQEKDPSYILMKANVQELPRGFDVLREKFELLIEIIFLLVRVCSAEDDVFLGVLFLIIFCHGLSLLHFCFIL